MWNRLFSGSSSIENQASSAASSQSTSDLADKLAQDLEVTPPSPSIMRGGLYDSWPKPTQPSGDFEDGVFRLLDLPTELVSQIIGYLSPVSLARVASTCRELHSHAFDEQRWKKMSKALNLPCSKQLPLPFSKWQEFYSSHYPYWFLPKHKLWFADKTGRGHELTGQFVLARYDYRMGNIELYRLYAENSDSGNAQQWAWNPDVLIHPFRPRVRLLLDDPIVKLEVAMYGRGGRLQKEVPLTRGYARASYGLQSNLMLSRPIPPKYQDASMVLWPPRIFPAIDRVRNSSRTLFQDNGHKPSCYDELSESTFRTRVWAEFSPLSNIVSGRMGEDVVTWSTLPEDCYLPTKNKPYQGIWVGDYSGHGCEFLLVTQKSPEESAGIEPIVGLSDADRDDIMRVYSIPNSPYPAQSGPREEVDPPGCSGRLEALKLVGDTNVRRGEITFVAEDIGCNGFLRRANEDPFRGARVVKCWGHVASRGFRGDGYIPSQLIMISHDCLAQYWEEFGHVSYFKRVDIDQFLDVDTAPEEGVIL